MITSKMMSWAAIAAFSVAGCAYNGDPPVQSSGPVLVYPVPLPTPEQAWIDKGKWHFNRGEYGLAEWNYRQAVERYRNNIEALLGLAASYDHLKRFDEADRLYGVLERKIGNTPTLLNNLGFHYMLKGEFTSAEQALLRAQSQDPYNLCVRANLALLADWRAAAGRTG